MESNDKVAPDGLEQVKKLSDKGLVVDVVMNDIADYNCDNMCMEKYCDEYYAKSIYLTINDMTVQIDLCNEHAIQLKEVLDFDIDVHDNDLYPTDIDTAHSGSCVRDGCHEEPTQFTTININGIDLYLGFCDKCGDEFANFHIKKEEKKKETIFELMQGCSRNGKPFLKLPSVGRLISNVSEDIGDILKETKTIFFRPDSMDLVEVGKYVDNEGNELYDGFVPIKASKFITLVEKFAIPGNDVWVPRTKEAEGYMDFKIKSMKIDLSKVILDSSHFQDKMPNIKRIFTVPLPIMHNDELSFPKKGFDIRYSSWLPFDSPDIEDDNMTLEDAKDVINEMYSEFCFKDKQDLANALAAAITPFCRGLFSNFNVRTPVGFYKGNRPRVGKDCLAGITGITYEGYSLSEPPISSGESGNNNEELRKKLMAAMMAGRRRLHFANNKGKINNSVFEAVITENVWSDRLLGGNKIGKFNNEIDYSLSGNTNITLTPDLEDRCLFINLFLDIENANDRVFKKANLHEWVIENRGKILSAFYSLVKNWIDKGSVPGSVPFASFHEWSTVVGGIIESAGYENPCNRDKNTQLSINDPDKEYMKQIYEYFFTRYPNKWIKKDILKNEIRNGMHNLEVFPYLDFNLKRDQMKLSTIIDSYEGRILSDIKFKINDINVRGDRQEIIFEKKEGGDLGDLGDLKQRVFLETNNDLYKERGKVPKVTEVPKNITIINQKDEKSEESDTKLINKEEKEIIKNE